MRPKVTTMLLIAALMCVSGCAATPDSASPSSSAPRASPTATSTSNAAPPQADPAPSAAAALDAVAPGTTATQQIGDRSFELTVPAGYQPATPAPLLIALHGYGDRASKVVDQLGLLSPADERGVLLVAPEGLPGADGQQSWHTGDVCCTASGDAPDDVGFLEALIDAITAKYAVDSSRIWIVGFSDGAFMAQWFACVAPSRVSAIVSLEGGLQTDPACANSPPVSVLIVHATEDRNVPWAGGTLGFAAPFASVDATLAGWIGRNGCSTDIWIDAPPIDTDAGAAGPETTRRTWVDRCRDATQVALWTVVGGGHVPTSTPTFAAAVLDWLGSIAPSRG